MDNPKVKLVRKNPARELADATLPSLEDINYIMNDKDHLILKTFLNEFKKNYHESVIHLPSIDGSKPSLYTPQHVIIPEYIKNDVIILDKTFNVVLSMMDPLTGEVKEHKHSESLELGLVIGDVTSIFTSLLNFIIGDGLFFCPRPVSLGFDPTLNQPGYYFLYEPLYGYSNIPEKSQLFSSEFLQPQYLKTPLEYAKMEQWSKSAQEQKQQQQLLQAHDEDDEDANTYDG